MPLAEPGLRLLERSSKELFWRSLVWLLTRAFSGRIATVQAAPGVAIKQSKQLKCSATGSEAATAV